MLETDYCPYCDAELEIDDVVELCELDGNEQDELVECPNCGRYIRANFETRIHMSLVSEEDYLEHLEHQKEIYEENLNTEYGQKSKDFFEFMIDEVNRKMGMAKLHIEQNEEIEDES